MTKSPTNIFENLACRLIHRLIKRHVYAEFCHLDDGTHYGQFSVFGYVYSSWLIYEDRKTYTVFRLTFEEPDPKELQPGDRELENLIEEQVKN